MINRDELKVSLPTAVVAPPGAEVTVGSVIPQGMRRFIYRVKFINQAVGVNQLAIGKRENDAAGTTWIDFVQAAVPNEMVTDPDELKDDAAPLYVIDGGPGNVPPVLPLTATSIVRAITDNGNGIFTYWYLDAPA